MKGLVVAEWGDPGLASPIVGNLLLSLYGLTRCGRKCRGYFVGLCGGKDVKNYFSGWRGDQGWSRASGNSNSLDLISFHSLPLKFLEKECIP
jgi:hypothetical protein